ncbi:uncharacterized protein BT62DRAFT_920941 [Guyanagaster necrorhizus]|uniref:Uncharacterized protein n=1 Tax=Guyanagaster necrorhizus TaxID=856835 RepID=A0A9P7VQ45_9AGAR|nr:uncharacterized protein BT62DRAFT_920941 [Guyanagaster necrorhizus MCA 3950]KAG7444625.1 hypothetical protein BT62DRAFT_920941 [Guyanagaster necrorhizus MCA 3950]
MTGICTSGQGKARIRATRRPLGNSGNASGSSGAVFAPGSYLTARDGPYPWIHCHHHPLYRLLQPWKADLLVKYYQKMAGYRPYNFDSKANFLSHFGNVSPGGRRTASAVWPSAYDYSLADGESFLVIFSREWNEAYRATCTDVLFAQSVTRRRM